MKKRIKLLLAEDDAIIALSTSRILIKNGYDVIIVHNGIKSIEAVKNDPEIDLVLMDINLGSGIDGTEAAKEILKIKALPVIFLTSHSEKEVVDKVKKITRYGYVIKNSGEFVLLEAISMAMELFTVNQELKKDIYERIKTEKELKLSENRLNTIFLSSPAGICVNTADKGLFVDINEAFTKITGYSKEDLVGKEPIGLGLWFNEEFSRLAENTLQNTGKISNIEITFRKKSGDIGFAMISSEFIIYNNMNCVLTLINDLTENKNNLSALSESRKILNNSQKAAGFDFWTVDLNSESLNTVSLGDIKWFDSENGFEFDEILKVTHPDDLELVRSAWEGAVKGESYELEHRVIINNEIRWFFVKADVEKNELGVPVKIIGVTIDITERKNAEEENHHSISLLQATLESTADGILVVGIDGKIKSHNHQFSEMWKLPPELIDSIDDMGLLKYVMDQLIEPEDFLKKIKWLYGNPENESFDKLYFKDGRVFERYSLPQKINNDTVGRVWSFRDISEKVTFEKALKRSEERTSAIINSVPDLLFIIDNNGLFVDYYCKNEEDLYVSSKEFLGRKIKDILPGYIAEVAEIKIESAIKNKRQETFEYGLVIKNEYRLFEDRIVPVSENEVLSIIRDITEAKKAQAELIRREKIFTEISLFAEKIFREGINDDNINYMLSGLGKAFDISRSYIFKKTAENDNEIVVKQIYEWCADNIISSSEVLDVDAFRIPKNTPYSTKIDNMLSEGFLTAKASMCDDEYEKYLMEVQNLKTYMFIPIFAGNNWWGLIGFDDCKNEREWNEHEVTALKTASNLLGSALQKSSVESALADSTELYHSLIKASPDSVTVTDIDGKLIFASDKALELFGYLPDEDLYGRSIFSWASDDSRLKAMEHFGNLLKNNTTKTDTYVLIKKDGTEFLGEITACSYFDSDNNSKGLIIVARDITNKVIAEQKLTEEAVRRKILIDESSDGIVVLDDNGKVFESNKKFSQMLGYDINELNKMYVWDWDTFICKEKIIDVLGNIDDNGSQFESKHKRKDGSVYDVEISSNGAVVNGKKLIFCVCRDITQRNTAQKKIKESEERFSKIFHNSPVGISISRISDGVYVDVNEALLKIGGYTRDEVIGHSTIELKVYDENTREKFMSILKKVGRLSGEEHSFPRKDGSIANVIFSLEIIELNGEMFILGIVVDITARKAAEKKIKESEEKFSKIFHLSPIGIGISKYETRKFTEINETFRNMIGYEREEILGKTSKDLALYDMDKRESIFNELSMNGNIRNTEVEFTVKSGKKVNVLLSFELIELNGEKFILGTIIDISDKKESELRLLSSLNEKDILLKELQHRVKNNLSVISSLLHLEMANLEDENSKNIFQNSITRINSLSTIYEQLYSSNELTRIELSDYLKNLIRSLDSAYKISGKIKINTKIVENSYIDLKRSVLIGLIFNELITNSLKYSYPGDKEGVIEAGFSIDNGNAVLHVRDHGVGMPAGYDIEAGKSLGLKLVKMLTEQLEGVLKIVSDKGTFTEVSFKV